MDLPIEMVEQVNAVFPSSQATSNIQLNYRRAITENCLKSSGTEVLPLRTTVDHLEAGIGGAVMLKGLVPHPRVAVENQ